MTQAERVLRFVHETSERKMKESAVLLRIEHDELVVTRRWRADDACSTTRKTKQS
jgi:hypothetical protein